MIFSHLFPERIRYGAEISVTKSLFHPWLRPVPTLENLTGKALCQIPQIFKVKKTLKPTQKQFS